jgi:hypothetical protein
LAWLLAKEPFVIPIPGTRDPSHLVENLEATGVQLSASVVRRLDTLINERTVVGDRYNAATQQEIDTENS